MQHRVTWVEIPVSNLERATKFYQQALNVEFKHDKMGDYDYAMFLADDDAITGALVVGEGYQPSTQGSVVYLDGGNDLNPALKKIASLGNTILVEKTPINDGDCGYFAQFIDSEGNRVGLYSKG